MMLPNARLLFIVNVVTILAVVTFAAGVVYVLLRRVYHRRVEEQKLAAMGTATARILHQIKNPLQTIMLHADLLQDPVISTEASSRREICDAIVGEAQRLAAMLNELSVYASGAKRALSLAPFSLHELLRGLSRSEARKGRVEVQEGSIDPAVVLADPYYLQQALENLIANAADAMEGQSGPRRLILALEHRGEQVFVSVRDTGPGIAPERLPTIFQPFVSTKGKGMGLGLAICREIIEGHGGRIEVQSQEGSGTEFRILLPAPAHLNDPAPRAVIMGGAS